MKRSLVMAVVGAFTTLVVVGGTIAAAQSGAFSYSSTTVLPNSEILVPEITPTEQQPYTAVETKTVDIRVNTSITATAIAAKPESGGSAESKVIEQGSNEREAELIARLNQAYALLQQRDREYQARLNEAYDKLKPSSADINNPSQAHAPSPSSSSPALSQSPSPTAALHEDVQHGQQQPPRHDGTPAEIHHEDNKNQAPQDQHHDNSNPHAGKDR